MFSIGLCSPEQNHYWFLKPSILGACLSSAEPNSWEAWCGVQTSFSLGRSSIIFCFVLFLRFFLIECCCTGGRLLDKSMSLPLLHFLVWSFYHLLWSRCLVSSQVLFTGNCSICSNCSNCSIYLLCPWKEVSSGYSYTTILNHLPRHYFSVCIFSLPSFLTPIAYILNGLIWPYQVIETLFIISFL